VLCAAPATSTVGADAPRRRTWPITSNVVRENRTDYAIRRFGKEDDERAVREHGSMISNDGDIATRWCLDQHGLIVRSLWQVAPFIRGRTRTGAPRHTTAVADIDAIYPSVSQPPAASSRPLDHLRTGLQERPA
jgi:DNA-binding transcriptional LysR family regulator